MQLLDRFYKPEISISGSSKKSFIILFFLLYFSFLNFTLFCIDYKKSPKNLNRLKKSRVKKIYDGDTIKISSGEIVRLLGVDTPEMNYESRKSKEYYALKAKKFTKKYLMNKKVYLEFDRKKYDKYDRLLAYVYNKNGMMLNNILIKKGLAEILIIPPNNRYKNLFYRSAKKAVKDNKGKWKRFNKKYWREDIRRISYSETESFLNNKVIVKGVIKNTFDTGRVIFLDFTEDYKNGLTIIIYKKNRYLFPFDPEKYYLNRKILVSGKIQQYNNKNQISINHLFQIKIK